MSKPAPTPLPSGTLRLSPPQGWRPVPGQVLLASPYPLSGYPGPVATCPAPLPPTVPGGFARPLRAGVVLEHEGHAVFQVQGRLRWPHGGADGSSASSHTPEVLVLECLHAFAWDCELELSARPPLEGGRSLAWITMSDKGSAGLRQDASGPGIATALADHLTLGLVRGSIIPDEPAALKALLMDLALGQGFDLIVTTGGTGLAPRDITPEATLAVIEKRLPGFEQAMTATSLAKTPHAAISRAVVGTLGWSIIVNLPGSPKAVAETLAAIGPALEHALAKLQGDPSDCAR